MALDLRNLEGNELLVAGLVFVAVFSAFMVGLRLRERVLMRDVNCLWKYDKILAHENSHRWVCSECGETGYSRNSKPPVNCKKRLTAGRL